MQAAEGSLPETTTTEPAASFWRVLARNKPAVVATVLFAAFIVVGLAAPAVAPSDPLTIDLDRRLQPPVGAGGEWSRPLGCDQIGRDLLRKLVDHRILVVSEPPEPRPGSSGRPEPS